MISNHFNNKLDNLLSWNSAPEPKNGFTDRKVCIFYHKTEFNQSVLDELLTLAYHFENISIFNWGHISFKDLDQLNLILKEIEEENYTSIFLGASSSEAHTMWTEKNGNLYLSNRLSNFSHFTALTNINYIGYQRHFSDLTSIKNVESTSLNPVSLGRIRTLGNQIEPILRDTCKAYIDLNILKTSELPGNPDTWPAGLNAEELCQIMRYIGEANHLSTIIINTNLSSQTARNTSEVKMMALSVWYLLEGINFRLNDHPIDTKDHQTFIVDTGGDVDFIFKRHNSTHRWWLELDNYILACTQQEYEECVSGNIPPRISKLI